MELGITAIFPQNHELPHKTIELTCSSHYQFIFLKLGPVSSNITVAANPWQVIHLNSWHLAIVKSSKSFQIERSCSRIAGRS
jgi:hypothetical protein